MDFEYFLASHCLCRGRVGARWDENERELMKAEKKRKDEQ